MTDADRHWSLSNPGPGELLLWLEPWAEEFVIAPRSTVVLKSFGGADEYALGEVEWTPDHLVIWARAQTVQVVIDGEIQDSGSTAIPIPEGLTKQMLDILFAGQSAARLGGAPSGAINQTAWWQRLGRRLGL